MNLTDVNECKKELLRLEAQLEVETNHTRRVSLYKDYKLVCDAYERKCKRNE